MNPSDLKQAASLPALFLDRVNLRRDAPFLRKRYGHELRTLSWNETRDEAFRVGTWLIREGMKPGARVALMAENGPELSVCDMAVQVTGGVSVPIYTTSTPLQIRHVLEHSNVAFLFLGTETFLKRVRHAIHDLQSPIRVVIVGGSRIGETGSDIEHLPAIRKFAAGFEQRNAPEETDRNTVMSRIAEIRRDRLSAIIYTSGTTGPAKGVMLSHENILSNCQGALERIPFSESDVFLSFLPMSHSFERSMGHYAVLAAGATIHYARSLATVPKDFLEASPTVAMVVPRFLMKMRQRVSDTIATRPPLSRWLIRKALTLRLKALRRDGEKGLPSPNRGLLARLAGRLVTSKFRARLGGRIRFLVSGGAAMSFPTWEFFETAGIPVLQGYGLTETSPVVSVNPPDRNRPRSVGKPLNNVGVRIAEDGEIEIAGPAVMMGYWNDERATRQMISPEGWLKTGDVGHLDDEGYLYITDRKKDLIVSSSGKNISPQNIENALCAHPLVEYACVVGEGRRALGALLSPGIEPLRECIRDQGFEIEDLGELVRHPRVEDLYRDLVKGVNEHLAPYERIQRFRVVERPFSIEHGELTPTLKVRRRQVEKIHARTIRQLFPPRTDPGPLGP